MDKLEIIYFYEEGKIHPFIKEEKESNIEYHENIKNITKNNKLTEELKKQLLLSYRTKRYLDFIEKGHNYYRMKYLINDGIEKISGRKNPEAINELQEEKDGLNLANGIVHLKKKTRKPQL